MKNWLVRWMRRKQTLWSASFQKWNKNIYPYKIKFWRNFYMQKFPMKLKFPGKKILWLCGHVARLCFTFYKSLLDLITSCGCLLIYFHWVQTKALDQNLRSQKKEKDPKINIPKWVSLFKHERVFEPRSFSYRFGAKLHIWYFKEGQAWTVPYIKTFKENGQNNVTITSPPLSVSHYQKIRDETD